MKTRLSLVILLLAPAPLLAQDPMGVPHCATATAEVERLWCQGAVRYQAQDYPGAIVPWRRALALEQQHRQLQRNAWLVLIDDLTIAYGISGDLKNAKTTVEYGLGVDPNYPMFYYNLACVYAGMGDEPRTIATLRQAFDRRANVTSGEAMPDPRTDDSFTTFMADTAFAQAVARLPGIGR